MKNATFTLLLALITLVGYSQNPSSTFNIKDYSLKDYVAPDIRFRQLNVLSDMYGNGSQRGDYKYTRFSGNARLVFDNYINVKDFQGSSYSALTIRNDFTKSIQDTLRSNKSSNSSVNLFYYGQNRWYNHNDRFFGFHPSFGYNFVDGSSSYTFDTITNTRINEAHEINVSFLFSVGSGRIQPVTAARRAMDILISLQKYNRLAKSPTSADIDSLSHIANRIAYKRFFDRRYKRVYQLEELDKGIRDLELVDNLDMVYAANLSDIWGYGRLYSRGSGTRFETGLVPVFSYDYSRTREQNFDGVREVNGYGGFAFVSWLKQVPISYAWQSDFSVDLSGGIKINNGLETNQLRGFDTVSIATELLNMSYSLGYYPNTRTFVSLTPFASLAATQWNQNGEKTEKLGLNTGFNLNSYYYISPRFRLSLSGGLSFLSDEYFNQTPFPTPQLSNSSTYYRENENISGTNSFRYKYQLTLSYAIF
jgi:hypothetical protein